MEDEKGVVPRLFEHLKWLAQVAAAAPDEKPPVGWAFRVQNSAVRLQFYLVYDTDLQQARASDAGTSCWESLQTLESLAAKLTKSLCTPEGIAAARDRFVSLASRDKLVTAIQDVLTLAVAAGFADDLDAMRHADLEAAPDVAQMLRDLQRDPRHANEHLERAREAMENEEELADLGRAIAGAIAARSPRVTSGNYSDAKDSAQHMATAFLGIAIQNLPGRHRRLRKTLAAIASGAGLESKE